ncbi:MULTISPECIES: DMT family transporter [Flaviflexus]|uniref:Multidrug efflux SMR transporter n=1 Tax=Flaviflexus ciconiae TaxID=2496867 RepID=A0A3S9PYR2_9ACTO|nr:multidrug efflux SMR transporter [Flaviflexus ciconiae]AZQ77438.1 multidrug efflux SMR transporter [Flaviflexus ciconiae]
MNWFVLVASGLFEAVWATALGQSDGLRKPIPSLIFVVASIISLGGLAWAMTSIPTGTAYAVWTAIGAVTTTVWALATGAEKATTVKLLCLLGIVACVVGLKVTS